MDAATAVGMLLSPRPDRDPYPAYEAFARAGRLEAEVALPALLRRFPDLEPAGPSRRRARLTLRGWSTLPVHPGP